jgi:hypothetical protein
MIRHRPRAIAATIPPSNHVDLLPTAALGTRHLCRMSRYGLISIRIEWTSTASARENCDLHASRPRLARTQTESIERSS